MSTTITRRPSSTDDSVGITLAGGGGTLHQTLNDSSDTTYATCADGSYGAMRLGTATLPAGAILRDVELHIRLRGTPPAVILAALDDNPPVRYGLLSPSFVTESGPELTGISTTHLAAGLVLEIGASGGSAAVADIYLDIVYVEKPVVTVTAPSGTIAVTQPTVRWNTAVDVDDEPQSRFELKIFSQAQFDAAGFNPATSTPFYGSGEQLGSARSFTPVTNLVNGETYRFYVRAAHLVGSVTQWSDWDYNEEDVSVTPPPTPTLTIKPNNALARIKIKINNTGSPTWDHVTLQRTADGGGTWTAVRSAERATTSGHNFALFDYETGNGQPVQYRAQAIIADPAGDIASDWSPVSLPAMWESDDTWLKSPTQPTLNAIVLIEGIPTLKRRINRGVFDVAGRADPIVVNDVRKRVEGDVTFTCPDEPAVTALQALLDLSETLLLQTPDAHGFGSRYIACGDEDEDRPARLAREAARLVSVPFNEVLAPVGTVRTFGATWDDVAAGYSTWDDVAAAYPTWNALARAQL